jgi:hypothetical protein
MNPMVPIFCVAVNVTGKFSASSCLLRGNIVNEEYWIACYLFKIKIRITLFDTMLESSRGRKPKRHRRIRMSFLKNAS